MNKTPHDSGSDAAAHGERQTEPSARTGPWTGAGPIIRNPPNPSQPYGVPADESVGGRRPRSIARRAAYGSSQPS